MNIFHVSVRQVVSNTQVIMSVATANTMSTSKSYTVTSLASVNDLRHPRNVIIDVTGIIWSKVISGTSGNTWHQCRLQLNAAQAPESCGFRLVLVSREDYILSRLDDHHLSRGSQTI